MRYRYTNMQVKGCNKMVKYQIGDTVIDEYGDEYCLSKCLCKSEKRTLYGTSTGELLVLYDVSKQEGDRAYREIDRLMDMSISHVPSPATMLEKPAVGYIIEGLEKCNSLTQWVDEHADGISEINRYKIALSLISSLEDVHREGVCVGYVSPDDIFISPKNNVIFFVNIDYILKISAPLHDKIGNINSLADIELVQKTIQFLLPRSLPGLSEIIQENLYCDKNDFQLSKIRSLCREEINHQVYCSDCKHWYSTRYKDEIICPCCNKNIPDTYIVFWSILLADHKIFVNDNGKATKFIPHKCEYLILKPGKNRIYTWHYIEGLRKYQEEKEIASIEFDMSGNIIMTNMSERILRHEYGKHSESIMPNQKVKLTRGLSSIFFPKEKMNITNGSYLETIYYFTVH